MGLGSQMFVEEDRKHAYTGTYNYADDDMNWLYSYMPALKSYSCPSTKNEVRTNTAAIVAGMVANPNSFIGVGDQAHAGTYSERIHSDSVYFTDLTTNGGGKEGAYGSSYEVSGYWNSYTSAGNNNNNTRKTERTCSPYITKITLLPYTTAGQSIGSSDTFIIYDADDRHANDPTRLNDNYPDRGDNHGAAGGNMVFCDGHAQWVAQKNYLRTFILGSDEYPSTYPIQ